MTDRADKTSYPLSWPDGRTQTPSVRRRTNRNFKVTFATSRNECLREIRLLGGKDVIISTNLGLRRDGSPAAIDWGKTIPEPGVAVYFTRNGKQMCFACDCWHHIQDNMHAIALTIGALRGIARWGTGDMMEAAFRGFAALPERAGGANWWDTLGVPINATAEQVKDAYRLLVKKHHPDAGGDPELFRHVQEAWNQFESLRRSP